VLPWHAHGGQFVNLTVRPRIWGVIVCNEWKTEKCHECTNMGKVWWRMYVMWLPVRDL